MIENAKKYQALGWKIFPIKVKDKAPATPNGFKDSTNDLAIIEGWWSKEDYNIGLDLTGICVIDIDTHGGVNGYASLTEFDMPTTITASTPTGGRHYYFKTSEEVSRKTSFRPGIDRLTNGYVLLPESTHPNGGTYQWLPNRSPWDLDMAELPKEFKENKTLTPWATAPLPTTTPQIKQDIKDRAILYVKECEPAIQGNGGHNQLLYAASALVNGFNLSDQEAINILWNHFNPMCSPPWDKGSPSQRKDFERKVEEARKTCMKPRGWLIGDEMPVRTINPQDQQLGSQIASSLLANYNETNVDKLKKAQQNKAFKYTPSEIPKIVEQKMPKWLREVRDCIEERATIPQPWFALGAATSLFSLILGKKYKFRGQRSNLFNVIVGNTSAGKNIGRDVMKDIIYGAELQRELAGEQVTSDRALLNVIKRTGRAMFMWDEVAHMIDAQNSKNASSSLKLIEPTLMTLFSSANSTYQGKDYAKEEDSLECIREPHCVIHGTTTPQVLFGALRGKDADSGYMARMLLWINEDEPEPVELPCFDKPSAELCAKIAEFASRSHVAEGAEGLLKQEVGAKELQVTPEAAKFLRKTQLEIHADKVNEPEGATKSLLGKTYEICLRMCIIATIADEKEVIDIDAAKWACAVVKYNTYECVEISRYKLDSDEFITNANKVMSYIEKKDRGEGVIKSDILNGLKMRAKTLDQYLDHLHESELILKAEHGVRGWKYCIKPD